jgi:hypothetical protein
MRDPRSAVRARDRAVALAATGHRGIVHRDPYGVALIIGPFRFAPISPPRSCWVPVASLCLHAYAQGPKHARRLVSLLVDAGYVTARALIQNSRKRLVAKLNLCATTATAIRHSKMA